MTRIIFGGAFGIKSQGDDASLVVLTRMLREHLGELDGVVISRHPKDDGYRPYGMRSVPNIEYQSKADSLGRWFRGFNPEDDRSDLKLLESEIATSNLLVLGAGNALIDQSIGLLHGPIPYFTLLTLMARMSCVPVMWFGLSVGPFTTSYGRKLSRLCAELASAVTVRDERSGVQLRKIGYTGPCKCLPDPVLGLEPPSPDVAESLIPWREAHGSGTMVAAVSLRALPPGLMDHEEWVRSMAGLCDHLVEAHGLRPLFIPQCSYTRGNPLEDDRTIAREVTSTMRHGGAAVRAEQELTVDQCLALYSRARIALCTRLHGSVFATINGVPNIAFSYNPKVSSFMEWLGQPEQVLSLQKCVPGNWPAKIASTLAAARKLSDSALQRTAQGRLQVREYAQVAMECLKVRESQPFQPLECSP